MKLEIVIPALLYGLLAIGMTGLFLRVIWDAIALDTRSIGEKVKLRRKEKLLKSFEPVLESGDWQAAYSILIKTLYLDEIRLDLELIDKVANHNAGILSRILIVADRQNAHLSNLAVVEDLLLKRCDLMRSYLEARKSRDTLLKKRKNEVPEWALDQYKKKIEDFSEQLTTNRKSLGSQLDKMLAEISTPGSSAEITYH